MPNPPITSRQNQRVRDAAKLRDRRQREKQQRFLIDGVREIERAAAAGIEIVEAYHCPSPDCGGDDAALVEQLAAGGAYVAQVALDVFRKIAFGERTHGIVAVAKTPDRSLGAIDPPPGALVAVLDRVEKPGNVGAIARSADAAGVSALVLADGRTDLFNPNAIRASAGALFTLPIAAATFDATRRWIDEKKLDIYVATPDAERLYTEVDWTRGGAIVLGNEAGGVAPAWLETENVTPIRLPMHGTSDSLNVSTTAAVIFFEAVRRRADK